MTSIAKAKFGDEYRYELLSGDERLSRVDPRAVNVTSSIGNGIVTDLSFDWENDSYKLPPRNEIVLYELHIGTFNSTKDGVPGTFDDAIGKLEHLSRLGINAIEIMPTAEFAGDRSWGYNPAHLFAVESAYGGPLALKRFVLACHSRGIGVIMDVVYNHFGPSDLSLWRFDGWSEQNKGGIYFYNDWRSSTPWGDTRPDYGRTEVRRFIIDNARYWLEEYRCDGLRFDMTLYIRSVRGDGDSGCDLADGWRLTQEINDMVHRDFVGKVTIAEDLQNSEWITKRTSEGGAGFDMQWDANFVHPIRNLVIQPADEGRSIQKLVQAVTGSYNGDPFERVIYSESHDEVANGKARVTSEIDSEVPDSWYAKKRSTLAAILTLTTPGVPMLFQGQDFLEDEWFRDTDPIDWSKVERYRGILNMYRDLIALRRNTSGDTKGLTGSGFKVLYEHDDQNVLVYHRWHTSGPGDDVLIMMNLSNLVRESLKIELPLQGKWQLCFNSDWNGYSADFSNSSSETVIRAECSGQTAEFCLAPYSSQILKLTKLV
jgi:1,4-alpha-glucan branching enzyme